MNEFEEQYLIYLQPPEIANDVRSLGSLALKDDLTIMCVEDSPLRCHRGFLANECQRYEPSLSIVHR